MRQTLARRHPRLEITNDLPAGRYRFRLVVVDEAGNASEPDELTVTVREPVVAQPVVLQPGVLTAGNVVLGGGHRINPNDLRNRVRRP